MEAASIGSLPPVQEVPAAHLEGRVLPNGWTVTKRIVKSTGATGGQFSVAYEVVNKAGHKAFLKALNISAGLVGAGSIVDRLAEFSLAYQFERDLSKDCTDKKMSRVIRLLDYGEVTVPEAGILAQVPYLIFEQADGDIRQFQAALAEFDPNWVLRTLKHATLGVEQLHAAQAAHQDLKPSNVLTQDGGREMKLGDLGRAERLGTPTPWSKLQVPGAVGYAPPEQLYGAFGGTWEERRAGDMYLLGSLAIQLVLGNNLTALMQAQLPDSIRVQKWPPGPYSSVLPYLRKVHADVIERLRVQALTLFGVDTIVAELVEAITQMTDPDPVLRGHPRDRAAKTSSYALRRYVSLLEKLAKQCELGPRRVG